MANELFTLAEPPTAIVAASDLQAIGILEAARASGRALPHDLSVIGFDNILASAYAPPGLTTFDAAIRAAAREIGEMLITVIEEKPEKSLTRLIRPTLVARASHGPAPQ